MKLIQNQNVVVECSSVETVIRERKVEKGNRKALRDGVFSKEEEEFITTVFQERYSVQENDDFVVVCEHGSWFVNWYRSNGDVENFSVHECSGPESITFEES